MEYICSRYLNEDNYVLIELLDKDTLEIYNTKLSYKKMNAIINTEVDPPRGELRIMPDKSEFLLMPQSEYDEEFILYIIREKDIKGLPVPYILTFTIFDYIRYYLTLNYTPDIIHKYIEFAHNRYMRQKRLQASIGVIKEELRKHKEKKNSE